MEFREKLKEKTNSQNSREGGGRVEEYERQNNGSVAGVGEQKNRVKKR